MRAFIGAVTQSLIICYLGAAVVVAASKPSPGSYTTDTLDQILASTCDAVFLDDSIDAFYYGSSPTSISIVREIIKDSTDDTGRTFRWIDFFGASELWYGNDTVGNVFVGLDRLYLKLCAEVGDEWQYLHNRRVRYLGTVQRLVMGRNQTCRSFLTLSRWQDDVDSTVQWLPAYYVFTLDSFGVVAERDYTHGTETGILQGVRIGDRYIGIPKPVSVRDQSNVGDSQRIVGIRASMLTIDLTHHHGNDTYMFSVYDRLGRLIVQSPLHGGGIHQVRLPSFVQLALLMWSLECAHGTDEVRTGILMQGR